MRYDIRLIYEICGDLGFSARLVSDQHVEIDLGHGAILDFEEC